MRLRLNCPTLMGMHRLPPDPTHPRPAFFFFPKKIRCSCHLPANSITVDWLSLSRLRFSNAFRNTTLCEADTAWRWLSTIRLLRNSESQLRESIKSNSLAATFQAQDSRRTVIINASLQLHSSYYIHHPDSFTAVEEWRLPRYRVPQKHPTTIIGSDSRT
jgi:hypothetical protein